MKIITIYKSLFLLPLLTTAHGAIGFYLGADGTNLITDNSGGTIAGYTGGGTILNKPDVSATGVLVANSGSGSITGIVMQRAGTTFDLGFTFTAANLSLPAMADIEITTGTTSGGALGWGFTNLQNVSCLTVTTSFAQPLAARGAGSSSPRAWGPSIQNRGTDVDFIATATFPDMVTLLHDGPFPDPLVQGVDFVRGTPTGILPSRGNETTGVTISGGSVPTLTTVGDPEHRKWIGIEGLDWNGDGDAFDGVAGTTGDESDFDLSYLNTIEWEICSRDGSAFADDTAFAFSMDGEIYNNTLAEAISATDLLAVPEPSGITLLGLGSLALLARRKR